MEKYKLLLEIIREDESLTAQYAAIVAKHESARDFNAYAAELCELAHSKGYDLAVEDIVSATQAKGEMTEEQLENVSGGGSKGALCWFKRKGDLETRGQNSHYCECANKGGFFCTWAGCQCHGESRCQNGWHRVTKDYIKVGCV